MTSKRTKLQEDTHFRVIRLLQENPEMSQRDLAAAVGVSVGGTGPEDFVFLGEAGSLARNGWDDPAKAKLWRYNQHYFDDLNAEDAEARRDWHAGLIARWIAENPPGTGSGWEPYPVSLRIVNWVKYALPTSTEPKISLCMELSLAT